MASLPILIELPGSRPKAISRFTQSLEQNTLPDRIDERYAELGRMGVEVKENTPVIPMFGHTERDSSLAQTENDTHSTSTIISGYWTKEALRNYNNTENAVKIWNNSELFLHDGTGSGGEGASIDIVRKALNVDLDIASGHGINVGIIDSGINHGAYPIENYGQSIIPGKIAGHANVVSHGCMCAAAVKICAPDASLYDYPVFATGANSEDLLVMLTEIYAQNRFGSAKLDVLTNSYSYDQAPADVASDRFHEVINFDHPVNEKFREIVSTGCVVVFSAGNCGDGGALPNCSPNGIGPGKSIHGPNSLSEVITVGAATVDNQRLGYSSQGGGWFELQKPDFLAYSRYHGNYGPGRPGYSQYGTQLDEGTSAAAPLLAGAVAMLMSVGHSLTPNQVLDFLIAGTGNHGNVHDTDTGFGIINAGGSLLTLSEFFNVN